MNFNKFPFCVSFVLVTFLLLMNPSVGEAKSQNTSQADLAYAARENLAYTIGVQAYIYGYPTVELYRTFYGQTLDPGRGHSVGVNRFNHTRKLVTPEDDWVVSPNNDTLYSRAWLDLRSEPIILSIPPHTDRFFAFPIGDFFHDAVASLGWWNVGEAGGTFALTAPGWQGVLPDGIEKIKVKTPMCWILARTLTSGDVEDLNKVHALQDQYSLKPLSQWRNEDQSKRVLGENYPAWNGQDPLNFFVILNEMLRINTPRPADEGLVATFKEIGLHPSQQFNPNSVDDAVRNGLLRAIKDAQGIMAVKGQSMAEIINGWLYLPGPKEFGTDYLFRAALETVALLHGESAMTVGYVGNVDGQEKPLDGRNVYEIRFDVPPPVLGFWSLTMYDGNSKLLVDNPINRYSVGDRTEGIQYSDDGSLTIYLQNQKPDGDRAQNWLPAPEGPFYVVIRAYNAKPEVFNGSWSPPPVKKIE